MGTPVSELRPGALGCVDGGDCTRALAAAIEAARGGGVLRLAGGTYGTTQPLELDDNMHLLCEPNVTIKALAPMGHLIRAQVSGYAVQTLRIEGLKVDGNGMAEAGMVLVKIIGNAGGLNTIQITNTTQVGLLLDRCISINACNVMAYANRGLGIEIRDGNAGRLVGLRAIANGGDGILVAGAAFSGVCTLVYPLAEVNQGSGIVCKTSPSGPVGLIAPWIEGNGGYGIDCEHSVVQVQHGVITGASDKRWLRARGGTVSVEHCSVGAGTVEAAKWVEEDLDDRDHLIGPIYASRGGLYPGKWARYPERLGAEVLRNPSMETDGDWAVNLAGAAAQWSDELAHSGTQAFKKTGEVRDLLWQRGVAMEEGRLYKLTGFVFAAAGATLQPFVLGQRWHLGRNVITDGVEWSALSMYVHGDGAASCRVGVRDIGDAPADFFLDDVSLRPVLALERHADRRLGGRFLAQEVMPEIVD